jgi:xanthine dehydrogenase accessory factor
MISISKSDDFREIKSPSGEKEISDLFFLEPVIPPCRLLIAGAGHIGKALAKIGQMLDFDVTVADDRFEFANSDNIPWADNFIIGNIGNILEKTDWGKDLFIVIVTRGHRDDSNALRQCIGSDAAYVGMIGSRNKVALMRKEFIEKGWATPEQWNRIHAPIGLDINSKTVEEIAVSIAAQLVQVRNGTKVGRYDGPTV